jgi:hypothetical protein
MFFHPLYLAIERWSRWAVQSRDCTWCAGVMAQLFQLSADLLKANRQHLVLLQQVPSFLSQRVRMSARWCERV